MILFGEEIHTGYHWIDYMLLYLLGIRLSKQLKILQNVNFMERDIHLHEMDVAT